MLMKAPGYRRGPRQPPPLVPTWMILLFAGVFVFLVGFASGVVALVLAVNGG